MCKVGCVMARGTYTISYTKDSNERITSEHTKMRVHRCHQQDHYPNRLGKEASIKAKLDILGAL